MGLYRTEKFFPLTQINPKQYNKWATRLQNISSHHTDELHGLNLPREIVETHKQSKLQASPARHNLTHNCQRVNLMSHHPVNSLGLI
jgi:hypothetical protein